MDVTLDRDMQAYVERELQSGRFATVDDVVRAALATHMQRERLEQLPPDELDALFPNVREQLTAGLAQARAGQLTDGEAFFEELEREGERPADPARQSA